MPQPTLCKICEKRRARRFCPAVNGDICPICCGTHRETELTCPLQCEYLQEAHRREVPVPVPEDQIAGADLDITEDFLAGHEELVLFCVYSLLQAALHAPGAVDSDVLSALESLVQTQRTLQSGLVYQHVSENLIAAAIQRSFTSSLNEYRKLRTERESLPPLRDEEVLKTLVFLLRLGQGNRNGKPRGRMFLDLMQHLTPETRMAESPSGLIL
jgi:hypothetical protein